MCVNPHTRVGISGIGHQIPNPKARARSSTLPCNFFCSTTPSPHHRDAMALVFHLRPLYRCTNSVGGAARCCMWLAWLICLPDLQGMYMASIGWVAILGTRRTREGTGSGGGDGRDGRWRKDRTGNGNCTVGRWCACVCFPKRRREETL